MVQLLVRIEKPAALYRGLLGYRSDGGRSGDELRSRGKLPTMALKSGGLEPFEMRLCEALQHEKAGSNKHAIISCLSKKLTILENCLPGAEQTAAFVI